MGQRTEEEHCPEPKGQVYFPACYLLVEGPTKVEVEAGLEAQVVPSYVASHSHSLQWWPEEEEEQVRDDEDDAVVVVHDANDVVLRMAAYQVEVRTQYAYRLCLLMQQEQQRLINHCQLWLAQHYQ